MPARAGHRAPAWPRCRRRAPGAYAARVSGRRFGARYRFDTTARTRHSLWPAWRARWDWDAERPRWRRSGEVAPRPAAKNAGAALWAQLGPEDASAEAP